MRSKLRVLALIMLYFLPVASCVGCSKEPAADKNTNTISMIEQIDELEKMAIAPPSMESMQEPKTIDELPKDLEQ